MGEDDIPPLLPPDQMPPVHNQRDLCRHWRALMGPLGFGGRTIWLCFVDASRSVTPHVTQIEGVPVEPDQTTVSSMLDVCGQVLQRSVVDGSVAVLLSRPGPGPITASDRSWARALTAAAHDRGVAMEPVHLANNERVCVFAPDDLVLPRSA